jgi:Spx/MgsR family transcriptional regulator
MLTLYGIKNCDTVKKARRWLEEHGIDYRFHDLRVDGLDRVTLADWVSELGWEALVNRRGTTWRRLPEATREDLDAEAAIDLMLQHPTLIKRPIMALDGQHHVGFSPATYAEILGS